MCGKFTQMMQWRELVTLADLLAAAPSAAETVTPMRMATVIARDEDGARRAVRMRWGMAGRHARDPLAGPKHIHARAETVDTLPSFRESFLHRRGLIAVSTFNEGKELTPTKTEQYVVTPKDGRPLAIAVIWERWTDRHDGELLHLRHGHGAAQSPHRHDHRPHARRGGGRRLGGVARRDGGRHGRDQGRAEDRVRRLGDVRPQPANRPRPGPERSQTGTFLATRAILRAFLRSRGTRTA